jgi:hypothetical protein
MFSFKLKDAVDRSCNRAYANSWKEEPMKTKIMLIATVAFLFVAAFTTSSFAEANIYKTPPANFKKVSSLVQLPDYLPGMGTLYVNPSTLPYGPYLGYDRQGKLVDVIYMVPIKDFDEHKVINDLGKDLPGLRVNHVDITYNPGHPGVPEPHYHITLWLISHAEEMRIMR